MPLLKAIFGLIGSLVGLLFDATVLYVRKLFLLIGLMGGLLVLLSPLAIVGVRYQIGWLYDLYTLIAVMLGGLFLLATTPIYVAADSAQRASAVVRSGFNYLYNGALFLSQLFVLIHIGRFRRDPDSFIKFMVIFFTITLLSLVHDPKSMRVRTWFAMGILAITAFLPMTTSAVFESMPFHDSWLAKKIRPTPAEEMVITDVGQLDRLEPFDREVSGKGKAVIFYTIRSDGRIVLFKNDGFDYKTGQRVQPVTLEILEKKEKQLRQEKAGAIISQLPLPVAIGVETSKPDLPVPPEPPSAPSDSTPAVAENPSASGAAAPETGGDSKGEPETKPPVIEPVLPQPRPEPEPNGRPTVEVTIPAGTKIKVRLISPLAAGESKVGDIFQATADKEVKIRGRILLKKGALVYGRVIDSYLAEGSNGLSLLTLTLLGFHTPTGEHIDVTTKAIQFGLAPGYSKDKLKTVIVGAVLGAAIGAAADGARGAAIGGAAGAGGGFAVREIKEAAAKPAALVLEAERPIEFLTAKTQVVKIYR